MPFPKKTCVVCGAEFELRPEKPGFANRCWECSVSDEPESVIASDVLGGNREASAARRDAMKNMLYRNES
jgi:hypothetical protein